MTKPLATMLAARAPALAHHLTMRLQGDRLLADSPARRRCLARVVMELAGPHGLLAFRAADTHLHLLVALDRVGCGLLARALGGALRRRLGHDVPFEPTRHRPVEEQRHLVNTFFYVLRQEQHHGTNVDPLHDASCLPDLVGARLLVAGRAGADGRIHVLGRALVESVRQRLPRVRRAALEQELCADDAAHPPSLEDVGDAAAAAFGLASLTRRGDVHLPRGDAGHPAGQQGGGGLRGESAHLARLAAVHSARERFGTRQLAAALDTTVRQVQRLGTLSCPPALVRAVDLQLRMRAAVRASALLAG